MNRPLTGLWNSQEAWDFLNTRLYMDEMEPQAQAHAINNLMEMSHRPHCRTHLVGIFPNYGSDCTCDGKYLVDGKFIYPETNPTLTEGGYEYSDNEVIPERYRQ